MSRESKSSNKAAERMTKLSILTILVCVLFGTYLRSEAQVPRREVAVTIDDLPMAGSAQDLQEMQVVSKKLLLALVSNRVPAIGFVNESKLFVKGETDARINLLRMWLDAGMTLGNHTFSHADLSKIPLQQFMDEVIHGEVVTRALLKERGSNPVYFRYPYNHTGTTKETKETFQAFLQSRGYRIAPFTIENEDYIFTDVYMKAKQKKDDALVRRIRAAYLDHLGVKFNYYEQRSRKLFGREVKQILLIHVNMINADCMGDMIQLLKARGYSFIQLDQALQDQAYQTKDDYVGKAGISWLHRWMLSLGKKLDFADDPDPPPFIMELSRSK